MKKKLSLLMIALVALTAFAGLRRTTIDKSVTYALAEGDTFTSGQTVDVKDGNTVVATITYGESGGANFNAAKADTHVQGYTAYTEGNGTNGNKTGGTFYTITPKYNGTIDIAVIINADKVLIVEEDGVALTGFETQTTKLYGTQTFAVKANKSYKCYVSGSKMGFYGFKLTWQEEAADPEPIVWGGDEITLEAGTDMSIPATSVSGISEGQLVRISATEVEAVASRRALAAEDITILKSDDTALGVTVETINEGYQFTVTGDQANEMVLNGFKVKANKTIKISAIEVVDNSQPITPGGDTGTIKFGNDDVKINSASVTGNDNLGNTWTITTTGTTSFSQNTDYTQVGKKDMPATSITFTTTLPKEVNITSLSAKFGGFGGTAGNVSLKVDETEVGSGTLDETNDVTISSTNNATGKVLTVSVTNIDKGVKCYYISYTYNDQTDQRVKTSIVFADGYATEGMEFTTIDLPTATVKDANENTIEGAAITWTSSNEEVATISGTQINLLTQGTTVIKATYAGDETAYRGSEKSYTLTVTETDQIAKPYVYVFEKKTFEDANNLTKKLKNVTWDVTGASAFGYDGTKGQQFGTATNPAKSLTVKLSDIPGTITSIKINTSGAKDIDATFGIKVGETDFKYGEATTATLTSTATEYEFTGSSSGDVVISYTQTSSKGIYIKSVEITYSEAAEEPKPLYITGNFQEGGWSTSAPVEMTFNEESSNYEYELTVNQAPMYFTIATGKADSWEGFGEYRMGIAAGDQNVTTDTEYQLANYADGTLVLNETGTFVVSVTSDLKMTITRKADTYVVAGAFVDANNESTAGMFINAWSADQESNVMWLDEKTGLYTKEYSVTFNAPVTIEYKIVKNSNVWYGDPNNNDPEDINKNYKYAITETGIYDITVTFDTKNELATMTATKQNSGDEPTESVLYSWEGNAEGAIQTGGTASATDASGADLTADDINIANKTFYVMRVRGANDFSNNVINIALDKALSAGDKIAITAYRNKNASDKPSGVKMKFEKGETTVGCETGYEYVNIDTSDASANDPNRGTDPNTITFTVPTVAEGSKTITLTRSHQSTNLFITKLVITTTNQGGGDEPEDPTGFTFRDFNTELNTLTENDESEATVTFGLSVAEDGAVSRVAADTENTSAVVSGKTGNDHGLQNFSATVPVEGAVKITMGTCFWGGEVTVKNAAGETVATFTTKKGDNSGSGCYKGNKFEDENIVSAKYVGDATTLTISGGAYVNFFAVEAIEATAVNVAYSLGEVECEGDILPTGGTFAAGDEYTIPANNFTLYKEGYTLTGWSDGKNTYGVGSKITLSESITLTPVFTQNEVSLADRTEPVTVKWNFRRDQGAPTIQWQGKDNLVWVAQAEVNGKTIDVATRFSTNPGKFNNTSWTDWCQLNDGTTFKIPSCKGATISIEGYNVLGEPAKDGQTKFLTIDGQSDYTHAKTVSYEIAGSAETVDVVIGEEGSYYRYIQAVLPVVQSAGGETFDNADAMVEWPMLTSEGAFDIQSNTTNPDGVFSVVSLEHNATTTGVQSRSKDPDNGMKFATFKGANVQLHWSIKPAAGLTFTPTQIKMYVQRFGTNKKDGVVVTAKVGEGDAQTLGTFTARRANWDDSQEESQWGEVLSNLVNEVVIDLTAEQQAAFASAEGFDLYATTGLDSGRDGGFADVRIYGKINGTKEAVEMYTLALAANPEEAGSVSAYPNANEYEAGSEVTLTATENFGYDFVNWTNAAGEEVSTEAKFKYTVNSNETLTANFKAVETYELALTVDGTNDYMVTVSPAPTIVDSKWMYEAGTTVELTANQYEDLVTFTNWSDGETNSTKSITMSENTELTANYAQADIIAGWDFYKAGNNGRKADFFAQDNDADALNLVNTTDGTTSGWLDKSTEAGGGYESFKGAAVNWRTGASNGDVGHYHWQTKVNAEEFENINVQFEMLYNYNAYQTYDAEYSFDGENWTKFGSITMEGVKNAASFKQQLPAECNNKAELYIRMKADKTSQVDGTASKNDGNTLAMFFITGTPKIVDDGVAPVLVSTVPANNATGVSASGKIVLTFDERVKVVEGTVAYLNNSNIKSVTQNPMSPTVSGKVVTFEYKGLDYGTKYNFVLAGKTIGDLTDNMIQDAIEISFTTMERPTVDKKLYDAVVENVNQLLAAISAAQSRSDKNVRYRIFIKNGEYTIPVDNAKMVAKAEGYEVPECITFINTNNLSIIGESRDGVIITNGIDKNATFTSTYGTTSKYDGIGNSDVFQLSGSDYYFQDLTIETGMDDGTGRDLAIQDKATRTIYKNTGLRGYQDTWTSNNDNGLYYFEDGYLRGRTDYMCGKGDAFFNGVELRQIYGGYAAVPSKSIKYGFTYKGCTINGEESPAVSGKKAADVDGNYTLGRPWGSGTPVALFIDTKMNVVPSAIGWNEMSGGWPKRFAEYNSMTSTGSQVDLSGRKKWFGEKKDDNGNIIQEAHENNPVLTAEEALEAGNLHNMFGEWDPTLATEQAPIVTDVKLTDNELSWTGSNYALLYAIVKNGSVIDFTTDTTYDISNAPAGSQRAEGTDQYQIRAANEMGGLNEASEVATATDGIETVNDNVNVNLNDNIYNLQGIRVNKAQKGVYIIGGRKVVIK